MPRRAAATVGSMVDILPDTLPYGTWPSPLTPEAAAAASPRRDGARFVGDDVWWARSVVEESGRMAVFSRARGMLLPAPWNAASRVHEYGGGAWAASDEGVLFFVEKTDQCVWELRDGMPRRLTPEGQGHRFGGLTVQQGRLLAVRETHAAGERLPRRDIVEIVLGPVPAVVPLTSCVPGRFVAQPALSEQGRLAWVTWDHPDMPWDHTRLMLRSPGDTGDGVVAGGATAALQPMWVGERLWFVDDPTGRWNVYHDDPSSVGGDGVPVAVSPADADTGGPLWVLGTRWFQPLADGRVVAVRTNGVDEVVVVSPVGAATPLPLDATAGATVDDARGARVLVTASGVHTPSALWLVDVDDPQHPQLIDGGQPAWDAAWTPVPRAVVFDGPHGPVHAFDYPPTNPSCIGPDGERPPYIVFVHGGPTSHTAPAASAKTTFFTSRGVGVLDVNYGGSTGYGRAYRQRLQGQWGVVDVDDVAAAAAGLAASGRADPARLVIEGGSAGGWTVLAALTNTDVFAAGISRYGVGDARALAADTHDFESRYLDGLIGPLPDADAVYAERSPLSHPERFRVPVLLLQGADDPIVPPAQADAINAALQERGVPHAYVLYEGEGHGFRRTDTAVDVLRREMGFLAAVFGFVPAGIPPLALS